MFSGIWIRTNVNQTPVHIFRAMNFVERHKAQFKNISTKLLCRYYSSLEQFQSTYICFSFYPGIRMISQRRFKWEDSRYGRSIYLSPYQAVNPRSYLIDFWWLLRSIIYISYFLDIDQTEDSNNKQKTIDSQVILRSVSVLNYDQSRAIMISVVVFLFDRFLRSHCLRPDSFSEGLMFEVHRVQFEWEKVLILCYLGHTKISGSGTFLLLESWNLFSFYYSSSTIIQTNDIGPFRIPSLAFVGVLFVISGFVLFISMLNNADSVSPHLNRNIVEPSDNARLCSFVEVFHHIRWCLSSVWLPRNSHLVLVGPYYWHSRTTLQLLRRTRRTGRLARDLLEDQRQVLGRHHDNCMDRIIETTRDRSIAFPVWLRLGTRNVGNYHHMNLLEHSTLRKLLDRRFRAIHERKTSSIHPDFEDWMGS